MGLFFRTAISLCFFLNLRSFNLIMYLLKFLSDAPILFSIFLLDRFEDLSLAIASAPILSLIRLNFQPLRLELRMFLISDIGLRVYGAIIGMHSLATSLRDGVFLLGRE